MRMLELDAAPGSTLKPRQAELCGPERSAPLCRSLIRSAPELDRPHAEQGMQLLLLAN